MFYNKWQLIILFLISLAMLFSGCSQEKPLSEKKENQEPRVFDYLLGAEDIKAYQQTKEKIKDIKKTLEKRSQLE